jgi:hypothetical protein
VTKQRKNLLIFCLVMPPTIFLGWWNLSNLISGRDAHDTIQQIAAAKKASDKLPAGMERAEDLVRRVKAVDPGHAPRGVKVALTNYVVAMDDALRAFKNHENEAPLEQVCAQRAQELKDAVNHH